MGGTYIHTYLGWYTPGGTPGYVKRDTTVPPGGLDCFPYPVASSGFYILGCLHENQRKGPLSVYYAWVPWFQGVLAHWEKGDARFALGSCGDSRLTRAPAS